MYIRIEFDIYIISSLGNWIYVYTKLEVTLAITIQKFFIFGALNMKLPISQIQDLNEYPDKDPNDAAAEAYHQEMIRNKQPRNDYCSFLREAEKSVRAAQSISLAELVEKWG